MKFCRGLITYTYMYNGGAPPMVKDAPQKESYVRDVFGSPPLTITPLHGLCDLRGAYPLRLGRTDAPRPMADHLRLGRELEELLVVAKQRCVVVVDVIHPILERHGLADEGLAPRNHLPG